MMELRMRTVERVGRWPLFAVFLLGCDDSFGRPDAAVKPNTTPPTDAAADAAPCFTDINATLNSFGGYSGGGGLRFELVDGSLKITQGPPSPCEGKLTATQLADLLAAAERVQWSLVEYPRVLDCCCDRITYELDVDLTACKGHSVSAIWAWCVGGSGGGSAPLGDFAAVLFQIAHEISDRC